MTELRMRREDARRLAMPGLERRRRLRSARIDAAADDARYLEHRMFHVVACGFAADPALRADLATLARRLLPAPRTWLAAALTDADIGNGGFWQYFGNTTGDLTRLAIAAFHEIGLPARGDTVASAATRLFGTTDVPPQPERLANLERLAVAESASDDVRALDDAYVALARAERVDEPLRVFALAHAGEFFLD